VSEKKRKKGGKINMEDFNRGKLCRISDKSDSKWLHRKPAYQSTSEFRTSILAFIPFLAMKTRGT